MRTIYAHLPYSDTSQQCIERITTTTAMNMMCVVCVVSRWLCTELLYIKLIVCATQFPIACIRLFCIWLGRRHTVGILWMDIYVGWFWCWGLWGAVCQRWRPYCNNHNCLLGRYIVITNDSTENTQAENAHKTMHTRGNVMMMFACARLSCNSNIRTHLGAVCWWGLGLVESTQGGGLDIRTDIDE